MLLNVNFPKHEPRGVRVTRVGRHVYEEQVIPRVDPGGREYFWIGGKVIDYGNVRGSDKKCVDEGFVSVTPLALEPTSSEHMATAIHVAGPRASARTDAALARAIEHEQGAHRLHPQQDPRRAGLPQARHRVQGHHAGARRSARVQPVPRPARRALRRQALDAIVGIESRGFIFGAALASRMRKAFIPARKPGKLPAATHKVSYDLEYGSDAIEMHQDAIKPKEKVLVVDDLIATGGTAWAAMRAGAPARRRGDRRGVHHRADVPAGQEAAGAGRDVLAAAVLAALRAGP